MIEETALNDQRLMEEREREREREKERERDSFPPIARD